ncbi:MAG TPA: hypothetical protein VGN80_05790 [Devosiaceae bacterium]|jgi:hypothetical protein|nr:hypothetical protein [Devosiaceae bacterium]
MKSRKLIAALLVVAAPVWLLPPAAAAQADQTAPSVAELLEVTSLDQVFSQSGRAMEEAATISAIPLPAAVERAWRAAARDIFVPETMQARLAEMLEGRVAEAEAHAIAGFYGTELGRKISRLDRALLALEPEAQQRLLDEGTAILNEMGETSPRRQQFREMLTLVNAELAATVAAQGIRGMLIAMAVAPQRGDIEIPWSEIEAQLDAIMGHAEAEIAASQEAVLAASYSGLSDAELEAYLAFLRTPEAQSFYSLAVVAVASIEGQAMIDFGEALVARLNDLHA